jgi:hypothetical protein
MAPHPESKQAGRGETRGSDARKRRCSRNRPFRRRRDAVIAAERKPCFSALRAARRLPSAVRGPVEWSQGFAARARSACALRRAGGQPFVIFVLPSSPRRRGSIGPPAAPTGHRGRLWMPAFRLRRGFGGQVAGVTGIWEGDAQFIAAIVFFIIIQSVCKDFAFF